MPKSRLREGEGVSETRLAPDHAFFDVDETLILYKSMLRFLRFFLFARGEPEGTYHRLIGSLQHLTAGGASRRETNRAYYRLYAGESERDLYSIGRAWFDDEMTRPGFFLPETVRAHMEHRARGDRTVLVSGSFFPCLQPLADNLGVDEVHGTVPVIRGMRLTGEVEEPMIGAAKARLIKQVIDRAAVDSGRCAAYADHATDLSMLLAVGRPTVVGCDPVLLRAAARYGWQRLPGVERTPILDPPNR